MCAAAFRDKHRVTAFSVAAARLSSIARRASHAFRYAALASAASATASASLSRRAFSISAVSTRRDSSASLRSRRAPSRTTFSCTNARSSRTEASAPCVHRICARTTSRSCLCARASARRDSSSDTTTSLSRRNASLRARIFLSMATASACRWRSSASTRRSHVSHSPARLCKAPTSLLSAVNSGRCDRGFFDRSSELRFGALIFPPTGERARLANGAAVAACPR